MYLRFPKKIDSFYVLELSILTTCLDKVPFYIAHCGNNIHIMSPSLEWVYNFQAGPSQQTLTEEDMYNTVLMQLPQFEFNCLVGSALLWIESHNINQAIFRRTVEDNLLTFRYLSPLKMLKYSLNPTLSVEIYKCWLFQDDSARQKTALHAELHFSIALWVLRIYHQSLDCLILAPTSSVLEDYSDQPKK